MDDYDNKPELLFHIILNVDDYLKNHDQRNAQNWEVKSANNTDNSSWMDNHLS